MAAITQLSKPFLGSVCAFQRSHTSVRPRASLVTRCDKGGVWLPGVESPKWLDGSLPGDRAFDPLVLGNSKDRLAWFVEAEKTNGRWAMAAVAGILGQELLGVSPRWFAAGTKDYGFPLSALLAIEFLTLGALELKRYQGWKKTGESGFLNWFPFDPLNLNSEANAVKEVKNGRLAMVAFVGFTVQALVTRQGPIENLTSHLSDPLSNNFLSSIDRLPQVVSQTS